MKFRSLVAAAAVVVTSSVVGLSAHATTLTGNLTADNQFWAYISPTDGALGTLMASGNNWPSANAITPQLLSGGGTYYLHIIGQNENFNLDGTVVPADPAGGNPDALLGQFSLSDTAYHFANGTQTLVTNTADWRAKDSLTAQSWFAPLPPDTPLSFGTNGGANIWTSAVGGPIAGIGGQAEWIWSDPNATGQSFFSTTISSAVPEASTWLMLIVGFAGVGFASYRKKASGLALRMA